MTWITVHYRDISATELEHLPINHDWNDLRGKEVNIFVGSGPHDENRIVSPNPDCEGPRYLTDRRNPKTGRRFVTCVHLADLGD
jgi:hypothetical protein